MPVLAAGLNRKILRAVTSVAAAGLVVKLAAMAKEAVVAGAYGRSDAMDAFLAAFLIPNLLINLLAESMNQALIPTMIRVRLREGHEEAQKLLSSSMLTLFVFLAAVSVGMGLMARSFFPLVAWGFPATKLDLAVRLFWGLLPMVVLSGMASNCAAVANAMESFALPALAPLVMPLCIIVGTVALQAGMGVWALVVSTVAGAALQAGLNGWAMQRQGFRMSLRWHQASEATWEVARQYGPILLSSVVASGGLLVDQAFAATLPAGSVSTLVFAGKFVSVAVALLAGAVSSAITPYFSSMVAMRDWAGCRNAMRTWAGRMAWASLPISVALIAGSRLLVRLTLQHGRFGAVDTAAVAVVLAMYAIQVPFFVVSRVFYRFLLAMRRTDLILYCGVVNLVLDVVLDMVLMRWMGVAGIALATSLWTVSTLALLAFWSYRLLSWAERDEAPCAVVAAKRTEKRE